MLVNAWFSGVPSCNQMLDAILCQSDDSQHLVTILLELIRNTNPFYLIPSLFELSNCRLNVSRWHGTELQQWEYSYLSADA